jgi:fimbrial chaperone protein
VTNNDDNSTYLIQSWENDGQRRALCDHPTAVRCRAKRNTLRIIDATNDKLPQDRESLFWMNVKAIPSMDKSKLSDNTLQLAIISRIKLYYRPGKLAVAGSGGGEADVSP